MSRRWRSFLVVTGILAVIAGAFFVWIRTTIARRWEETLLRSEEIDTELAAAVDVQPFAESEALPGNAWEDYVLAGEVAAGIVSSDLEELVKFVRRQSGAQQAAAEQSLQLLMPALAHLRTGARRTSFQAGNDAWTLSRESALVLAMRARARIDASEGRLADAFRRLTELVRIGLLLGRESEEYVAEGGEAGLEEIGGILTLHKPSPAELDQLIHDLSILEHDIPNPGRMFFTLRKVALNRCKDGQPLKPLGRPLAPGWRHAWSLQLYLAATAGRLETWTRRIEALRDRPWAEAHQFLAQELAEAKESGNDVLLWAGWGKNPEMSPWILRARIRLLRASAIFRMKGEMAALPDPFGGSLQWDGDRVRSVGPTDDPDDDLVLRVK